MRTRRGLCYPRETAMPMVEFMSTTRKIKRLDDVSAAQDWLSPCKRRRDSPEEEDSTGGEDLFDSIPDDLVVSILCKLSSIARSPADLVNVMMTSKRLKGLSLNPLVLSSVSLKGLAVKAKNWTESAHRFLKYCADAGNIEACYTLGMIRFYCLEKRGNGASLMAKAAINSHALALYSLAVIQFNGSGGSKNDKDLRAGVALCARAAFLGHIDALRELGHCLQDGYGVQQNVAEGRRFLVQANAREIAAVISSGITPRSWLQRNPNFNPNPNQIHGCPLLSDFGCNVPERDAHPANRFLLEWFLEHCGGPGGDSTETGLRMCSHGGCGRPETRRHEFRRCSVCGAVNYCSRACQALDWKVKHKAECVAMERWLEEDVGAVGDGNVNGVNVFVPVS